MSDSFTAITHQRYENIKRRFGQPPFTLTHFRHFIITLLGSEEGTCRCEYCNCPLDLLRLQLDHCIPPVSHGGSLGLENLAPSCEECNQQKGQMRASAFIALLELVNGPKFSPLDCADVLSRLQSQLKLEMREQARLAAQRSQQVHYRPHQRRSA